MLKAKDGAKVIQLVPVHVAPQVAKGNINVYDGLTTPFAWIYGEKRSEPVLFLAIMDDGSVRAIGRIKYQTGLYFFDDELPDGYIGTAACRAYAGAIADA